MEVFFKYFLISTLFFFTGCGDPDKSEYKKATKDYESKNLRSALSHFENSMRYQPGSEWAISSARDASRISLFELKDYNKAIYFLRHLVLYSNSSEERVKSQKEIAYVYFDNTQEYQKAIIEFYKLLQMTEKDAEIAQYKLAIARANYYLNNFDQALSEINEIFRLKIPEDLLFDTMYLNSNIYIAQKKFVNAIGILNDVLKKFPDKSNHENISLALAMCYEENRQFKEAIVELEKVLETYKPKEYIELRLKKIKERLKNLPGAKGLHRK